MKNEIDTEIAESAARDWTPDEERELAMLMDLYTGDGVRREFNDGNPESAVMA